MLEIRRLGVSSGAGVADTNNTLYVDTTYGTTGIADKQTDKFPTIQLAIADAVSGDTIDIGNGAYPEALDLLGKTIHFSGQGVSGLVSLDLNGGYALGRLGKMEYIADGCIIHPDSDDVDNGDCFEFAWQVGRTTAGEWEIILFPSSAVYDVGTRTYAGNLSNAGNIHVSGIGASRPHILSRSIVTNLFSPLVSNKFANIEMSQPIGFVFWGSTSCRDVSLTNVRCNGGVSVSLAFEPWTGSIDHLEVEAVSESITIVPAGVGAIHGEYFDLTEKTGNIARVWIRVDAAAGAPSAPSGGRILEVNVVGGDDEDAITVKLINALEADGAFSAVVSATPNITYVMRSRGASVTSNPASILTTHNVSDFRLSSFDSQGDVSNLICPEAYVSLKAISGSVHVKSCQGVSLDGVCSGTIVMDEGTVEFDNADVTGSLSGGHNSGGIVAQNNQSCIINMHDTYLTNNAGGNTFFGMVWKNTSKLTNCSGGWWWQGNMVVEDDVEYHRVDHRSIHGSQNHAEVHGNFIQNHFKTLETARRRSGVTVSDGAEIIDCTFEGFEGLYALRGQDLLSASINGAGYGSAANQPHGKGQQYFAGTNTLVAPCTVEPMKGDGAGGKTSMSGDTFNARIVDINDQLTPIAGEELTNLIDMIVEWEVHQDVGDVYGYGANTWVLRTTATDATRIDDALANPAGDLETYNVSPNQNFMTISMAAAVTVQGSLGGAETPPELTVTHISESCIQHRTAFGCVVFPSDDPQHNYLCLKEAVALGAASAEDSYSIVLQGGEYISLVDDVIDFDVLGGGDKVSVSGMSDADLPIIKSLGEIFVNFQGKQSFANLDVENTTVGINRAMRSKGTSPQTGAKFTNIHTVSNLDLFGNNTITDCHVKQIHMKLSDQSGGSLVIGNSYIITNYLVGDDFINVGAASNATGIVFTATGTTPTSYGAGSTLTISGAHFLVLRPITATRCTATELYLEQGSNLQLKSTWDIFEMNGGQLDYASATLDASVMFLNGVDSIENLTNLTFTNNSKIICNNCGYFVQGGVMTDMQIEGLDSRNPFSGQALFGGNQAIILTGDTVVRNAISERLAHRGSVFEVGTIFENCRIIDGYAQGVGDGGAMNSARFTYCKFDSTNLINSAVEVSDGAIFDNCTFNGKPTKGTWDSAKYHLRGRNPLGESKGNATGASVKFVAATDELVFRLNSAISLSDGAGSGTRSAAASGFTFNARIGYSGIALIDDEELNVEFEHFEDTLDVYGFGANTWVLRSDSADKRMDDLLGNPVGDVTGGAAASNSILAMNASIEVRDCIYDGALYGNEITLVNGSLQNVGENAIYVDPAFDAISGGNNLKAAYAKAKTMLPHGLPLATDNRVTLFLPDGEYANHFVEFIFDQDFIDLQGYKAPSWVVDDIGNLKVVNKAGAVLTSIRKQAGNVDVIHLDDVTDMKISKVSIDALGVSSGNGIRSLNQTSPSKLILEDVEINVQSAVSLDFSGATADFDGALIRFICHRDLSTVAQIVLADDSDFLIQDSFIGHLTGSSSVYGGKVHNSVLHGTSGNWAGVIFAGLMENTITKNWNAAFTGVAISSDFGTQTFSVGAASYSGILRNCTLVNSFGGANTKTMTMQNCRANNLGGLDTVDNTLWINSYIFSGYQTNIGVADAGVSNQKFYNCNLATYPTHEWRGGSGQWRTSDLSKASTAEFYHCSITMRNEAGTTWTKGKHYNCRFFHTKLTPLDEAVFQNCTFEFNQGDPSYQLGAPQWQTNAGEKDSGTNECIMTLHTTGTLSGNVNGHSIKDYFAVNDYIDARVTSSSPPMVAHDEFEGIYQITAINYLVDQTEIVYTAASVTVTEGQLGANTVVGLLERTDYIERCEVKNCTIDEPSQADYKGYSFSRHLPMISDGNVFNGEPVAPSITSDFASSTVTCVGVLAGDTYIVNGLTYTAVAGVKADNTKFSIDTSDNACAADLADSIQNDVRAGITVPAQDNDTTVGSNIVTVYASVVGDTGNLIDCSSSIQARLSVPAAFLTGGRDGADVIPRDRILHVNSTSADVVITCLQADRQQEVVVRKAAAGNNVIIKEHADDGGATIKTLTALDEVAIVYSDGTTTYTR